MAEAKLSNSGFSVEGLTALHQDALPPSPIAGVILKTTARCDFACRHCYVFESADQTWQLLPRKIEPHTIAAVGEQIADHVEIYDIPEFQVILHGGEPFLYGKPHVQQIVEGIRSQMGDSSRVFFTAHSNARLLGRKNHRSEELLDYLQENQIGVSTSLDGDRRANDFYRQYRDGSSTYADTIEGISALKERNLLRGILAVIVLGDIDFNRPSEVVTHELRTRGVENYRALLEFEPKKLDFLLPLAHRGSLPPGMETPEQRAMTPYATWLKAAFDDWYDRAQYKYFNTESLYANEYLPDVRTFSSIINRLEGRDSAVEAIGSLGAIDSLVIDVDGQYGIVDTLASTAEGEYRLKNKSVHNYPISIAGIDAWHNARQKGISLLPKECSRCPVRKVCQGGYAPHRYDPESLPPELPYAKKSIYSSNLLDLISYINGRHVAAKIKYVGTQVEQAYYNSELGAF